MTDLPRYTHMEATRTPGCLRLRLASPDRRNALGVALGEQIIDALGRAEASTDCRAVVLSGLGTYFCSGLELPRDGNAPQWLSEGHPGPLSLFDRLARSHLISVAVIEGQAIGGGVGLAACCDLVVAGKAASFRLTETVIGLTPKVIMPFLARRIGAHRAYRLALTADEVGAQEAHAIGLADAHTADVEAWTRQALARIRHADPEATRVLKADHNRLTLPAPEAFAQAAQELKDSFAGPEVHRRLAELRSTGVLP